MTGAEAGTRPVRGGIGGMADGKGGGRPAVCANCLHPDDRHTGDGDVGRECGVEIAVTWSDGPVGCECERCIPYGTTCSVKGCGTAATRYRVDFSKQIAYDMCERHYDEAEPYGGRYYELTGSRRPEPGSRCSVDGCDDAAVHYVLGRCHERHDMCAEHFMEARPYRHRYYELTGGRPFPEGTPCGVDGCGNEAVQSVGTGGTGGGGKGGAHAYRNVCATHYGAAYTSSLAGGGAARHG